MREKRICLSEKVRQGAVIDQDGIHLGEVEMLEMRTFPDRFFTTSVTLRRPAYPQCLRSIDQDHPVRDAVKYRFGQDNRRFEDDKISFRIAFAPVLEIL